MNGTLILTAVELEAAGLARELELPALSDLPFRAFGRGLTRIVPVGLGAALLAERWTAAVSGLGRPLIVSAGVCGGLDPGLSAGDLVLPTRVLAPDGAALAVDVFEGELDGLCLCEVDGDGGAVAAFEPPAWAAGEVTGDPFFAGGHLAGLTAEILRARLLRRG